MHSINAPYNIWLDFVLYASTKYEYNISKDSEAKGVVSSSIVDIISRIDSRTNFLIIIGILFCLNKVNNNWNNSFI